MKPGGIGAAKGKLLYKAIYKSDILMKNAIIKPLKEQYIDLKTKINFLRSEEKNKKLQNLIREKNE